MNSQETHQDSMLDIAIIGMACRVPGAKNVDEFWQNLRDGVESIKKFSDAELQSAGIEQTLLEQPNYVKAAPILEDIDCLDAEFFGYSPREAELMDPQNRLFLESAWESLENAGYNPQTYKGLIGVYGGSAINRYLLNNLIRVPNLDNPYGFSSEQDFLTTNVSYKLNLKGPSLAVQTFCSTSLVATHLAVQNLLNQECDIALAGGVTIHVPHQAGYMYQAGDITSPDGHCRTFDAKAQGTVFGSGVGIVVLKRLEDAIADGDHIEAVIKGSAINNDGSLKVSFTSPSVNGQVDVIMGALDVAGISAETISYIEAHGTATEMGDPIEVAALTQAFRHYTNKKGFCAIGAVKTNFGHLMAASGVSGLIKTVLALKHKQIPPTLHFEKPNPKIDFANSPFYVNSKLSEWKSNGSPRRAGVSALGFGGTNAHIVVEEAPAIGPSASTSTTQLLVISAKTASALDTATQNLAKHLQEHPNLNLADVAYTLQVGRQAFDHRRIVVGRSLSDAALALADPKRIYSQYQEFQNRPVTFLFSGQGTQYVGMGQGLYESEPVFREHFDRCCDLLKPQMGIDLRQVLYPSANEVDIMSQKLQQTAIAQPAIFILEYALAQLWLAWGIKPKAMIGHSLGEYVAACVSEVLSLEDALRLVVVRGRLMQSLPIGKMLAVPLAEAIIRPLLNDQIDLAAINGSELCVVSGAIAAIDDLEQLLQARGIEYRQLVTSHAFHSKMMEPILPEFLAEVAQVKLSPPLIPYISNVTGTWITATEATDPNYWVRHIRQPVRFAAGLDLLLQDQDTVLLEIGAGRTLSTLARRHPAIAISQSGSHQRILTSTRHPQDLEADTEVLLTCLGNLWLSGVAINWESKYQDQRRLRLALPTYPFERQRYWLDPVSTDNSQKTKSQTSYASKKPDIADWVYLPLWKQTLPPLPMPEAAANKKPECWLVFTDTLGFGQRLVQRLKQQNYQVITVAIAKQFSKLAEDHYAININQQNDYEALVTSLKASSNLPQKVLHLWSLSVDQIDISPPLSQERFEAAQPYGLYSLLFLAQALDQQQIISDIQINVISNNLQSVTGEERLCPEKATLLAPCQVIPQEYPHISCRSLDVVLTDIDSWQAERLLAQCLTEIETLITDPVVAYRGNHRWSQSFEAMKLDTAKKQSLLRQKGTYLITGGLGNIGLTIAKYLARTVQAKLILLGRSGLPPRDDWHPWLATHDVADAIAQKIRKIMQLETLGAEIVIVKADVTNREEMQDAITEGESKLGKINGVIHAAGFLAQEAFGEIANLTTLECERHFQAKVYGLLVLDDLLQGKELDFGLLFSSLSSILGGLGYVAYSSVNLFMDRFAHSHRYMPWQSLNWDSWQFDLDLEKSSTSSSLVKLSITPDEGMETFARILSMGITPQIPQIAISTADLQTRISQWIKQDSLKTTSTNQESVKELNTARYSRPNLPNTYIAPRDELEKTICTIWQELFSLDRVGIDDNFFHLGGDSFLIVQARSKLQTALHQSISNVDLFEYPTIASLAAYLRRDKPDQTVVTTVEARVNKQRAAMEERASELMQRRQQDEN